MSQFSENNVKVCEFETSKSRHVSPEVILSTAVVQYKTHTIICHFVGTNTLFKNNCVSTSSTTINNTILHIHERKCSVTLSLYIIISVYFYWQTMQTQHMYHNVTFYNSLLFYRVVRVLVSSFLLYVNPNRVFIGFIKISVFFCMCIVRVSKVLFPYLCLIKYVAGIF